MAIDLIPGRKYNIVTKYPTILGGKHTGLLLEGMQLSTTLASNYGDVVIRHNTIVGMADATDPIKQLSASQLTWSVFKNVDTGEYVILADDYIDTIEMLGVDGVFKFAVSNVTPVDEAVIVKALAQLGYYVDTLE